MHATCPQNMPPLPRNAECGPPLAMSHAFTGTYYPSESEQAAIRQLRRDSFAAELKQVDALLEARGDGLCQKPERLKLMVGNAETAGVIREYLAERGHGSVDVEVASPIDAYGGPNVNYYKTKEADYWTQHEADAKAAAWDAQQPRHSSRFTKSQPSTKARKAARKRAKAGRKANR